MQNVQVVKGLPPMQPALAQKLAQMFNDTAARYGEAARYRVEAPDRRCEPRVPA